MLMMRPPPPWAIICLAASWVPKNALFRLMARTFSNCSSVVSSTEVRVSMPALLTMTSSRPKVETAVSIMPLQVLDLGDVGLDRGRLLAQGGDLALELLVACGVGDVVDDDVRALVRQSQHHRLADARVASGHDGDLALPVRQPCRTSSSRPPTALTLPIDGRTLPSRQGGETSDRRRECSWSVRSPIRHARVPSSRIVGRDRASPM